MHIVIGYIVCRLVASHVCDLVFGVVDNLALFTLCVYGLLFVSYNEVTNLYPEDPCVSLKCDMAPWCRIITWEPRDGVARLM